jgi:sulfur relay (sulfurtransferase) DsrC/TusE family protein
MKIAGLRELMKTARDRFDCTKYLDAIYLTNQWKRPYVTQDAKDMKIDMKEDEEELFKVIHKFICFFKRFNIDFQTPPSIEALPTLYEFKDSDFACEVSQDLVDEMANMGEVVQFMNMFHYVLKEEKFDISHSFASVLIQCANYFTQHGWEGSLNDGQWRQCSHVHLHERCNEQIRNIVEENLVLYPTPSPPPSPTFSPTSTA